MDQDTKASAWKIQVNHAGLNLLNGHTMHFCIHTWKWSFMLTIHYIIVGRGPRGQLGRSVIIKSSNLIKFPQILIQKKHSYKTIGFKGYTFWGSQNQKDIP